MEESVVEDTPLPPQRKRVSKACDRCRRRKDKCDGKRPVCGTCLQSNAVCSWNPLSKKRGLPDGYVRGLERICGAVIREVPGIEDLLLSKFEGDEDALCEYWGDGQGDGSGGCVEVWKKSRLVKELDRILPVLDSLGKKGKKRSWDESEANVPSATAPETTSISPEIIQQQQETEVPVHPIKDDDEPVIIHETNVIDVEPIISASTQAPIPESSSGISEQPISSRSLLESDWALPSTAGRLVEAYFSYTHSWFPIIERPDLLRILYQSPSQSTKSKASRSSGENAVLWAILAYAQVQYSIITSSSTSSRGGDESANLFYERAKSLVPVVDGEYELGHVQACLILAILKVGRGDWKCAWVITGLAVRTAMNLGLDQEQANFALNRRRRHVFLGCFVLDTFIAARLDRKPHLRSLDIDQVGLLDEEGLEEWDHWNDCLGIRRPTSTSPSLYQATTLSTFNSFVQLLKIMNDLICSPNVNPNTTETASITVSPDQQVTRSNIMAILSARLDQWKELHAGGDFEENLTLPSRCNTYLTYLTILMLLNLRYPTNPASLPSHYTGIELNTLQWLKSYAENFSLVVLPPIFEFSLKLTGHYMSHFPPYGSQHLSGMSLNSNGGNVNWMDMQRQIFGALSESWPVFRDGNLGSNSEHNHSPQTVYQSPRPNQQRPLRGILKNSTSIQNTSISTSTGQRAAVSISTPSTNTISPFSSTSVGANQWRAGPRGSPRLSTTDTNTMINAMNMGTGTSGEQLQPGPQSQAQSQLQSTRSSTTAGTALEPFMDQESIFQEVYDMDANLWSNTWEQSLLNLGFSADAQALDEEFYSFFGDGGGGMSGASGSANRISDDQSNAKARDSGATGTVGESTSASGSAREGGK